LWRKCVAEAAVNSYLQGNLNRQVLYAMNIGTMTMRALTVLDYVNRDLIEHALQGHLIK
jgi:hypothetical protein